jgi:hypothetical protein
MSEPSTCVFIPPNLRITDVVNLVFCCDSAPDPLPPVCLTVNSIPYDLPAPILADGRLLWPLDSVANFEEAAPDATSLSVTSDLGPRTDFNLHDLVFLGPANGASPRPGCFLIECISGLYSHPDSVNGEEVSFTIDSILTLDYRNVLAIRQQLDNLARTQTSFEEHKQHLQEAGIDLARLAELKACYEECMRKKRLAQYEFLKQNQMMQAAMIHSHFEQDFNTAVDGFRRHIEANRQRPPPPEPNREFYERLVRFRLQALQELKLMFPFSPEEGKLCSVQHYVPPASFSQWTELPAFLGFATHYIREVSRVVGIPLQYLLVPLAGSSRVVCRLTDVKTQLQADFSPPCVRAAAQFEAALVACCKHIMETLQVNVELSPQRQILQCLGMLNALSRDNLETLIPTTLSPTGP